MGGVINIDDFFLHVVTTRSWFGRRIKFHSSHSFHSLHSPKACTKVTAVSPTLLCVCNYILYASSLAIQIDKERRTDTLSLLIPMHERHLETFTNTTLKDNKSIQLHLFSTMLLNHMFNLSRVDFLIASSKCSKVYGTSSSFSLVAVPDIN